jgi:hypothetical protein
MRPSESIRVAGTSAASTPGTIPRPGAEAQEELLKAEGVRLTLPVVVDARPPTCPTMTLSSDNLLARKVTSRAHKCRPGHGASFRATHAESVERSCTIG